MRGGAATILAGLALSLAGCGDRFPDYRYRMTIYVSAPEGEKAFSSVRQVKIDQVSSVVDSSGMREKVRVEGEAVILELSNATVYALLNKPDDPNFAGYIPAVAFAPFLSREFRTEEAAARLQEMVEIEGPKILPRTVINRDAGRGSGEIDKWPMFVAFLDPSDPATVYEVSPTEIGVTRITVEMTNEPVTNLIEARLPDSFWQKWAAQHHSQLVRPGGAAGNSYFKSLQGQLSRYDFASGEMK